MRNHLLNWIAALSLGLFALAAPRAEAEEPFDTVAGYLDALQAGDTVGVKSHIGGRLYRNKELLLDQNDEYPNFLRKFYRDAQFYISDQLTDLGPQGQGVKVEVDFPGGNSSESIAVVEQADDGSWKVVDEIEASP